MAAVPPPVLEVLSPELCREVDDICSNPNAPSSDHKAAAKTLDIVDRTYNQNAIVRIQEFSDKLRTPHSQITHQYADRIHTAFEYHKEFSKKIKTLIEIFEKVINTQLDVCIQCPQTSPYRKVPQKFIQDALNEYNQIEAEFPQTTLASATSLNEYSRIYKQHTLVKNKFKQILENLPTIFDMTLEQCIHEKSKTPLRTKMAELRKALSETLTTFSQENKARRGLFMASYVPFQAHLEFMQEIIVRASDPQGFTRDTIQDWQRKISVLAQNESELEEEYKTFGCLLESPNISSQLIAKAAKALKLKMIIKANGIANQIRDLLQQIRADTIATASSRLAQRECGNPTCPLETAEKKKIKKRGKANIVHLHFGAQKCARCQQVYYCSAPCQKAHWPVHKLKCKPPLQDKMEDPS